MVPVHMEKCVSCYYSDYCGVSSASDPISFDLAGVVCKLKHMHGPMWTYAGFSICTENADSKKGSVPWVLLTNGFDS